MPKVKIGERRKTAMEKLEEVMEIVDSKLLDPYEDDHAMILLKK